MRETVVSLFSGCGGLDVGFADAGFEIIYACDNDPAAVSVYRANLGSHVELADITSSEFHSRVDDLPKPSVVLGGFPCQGFSKAGPKNPSDKRNRLFTEMHRVVGRLNPDVFVAENVDGIVQNFNGHYLREICSTFGELGYDVQHRVLDSVQYGVPQHRRRTFFVGVKANLEKQFRWPPPFNMAETRNGERNYHYPLWDWPDANEPAMPITIGEAMCDLVDIETAAPDHEIIDKWPEKYNFIIEQINEGQKLCNVRFSDTAVHTWDIPAAFGSVNPSQKLILETIGKNRRHKSYGNIPNGNPLPEIEITRLTGIETIRAELEDLQLKGYVKNLDNLWDLKGAMFCSGLFKRPEWSKPSPTVLTNFHNPRYFIHPKRDRPFSARECARLQGFSDSFMLSAPDKDISLIDKYRLVGNAVPPPLARALAIKVMEFINLR